MESQNKLITALVSLAAIIALVLGIIYYKKTPENQLSGTEQTAVTYGKPQAALKGDVVPNFPNQLLFDSANTVEQSYSIPYQGEEQYTVVLSSTKSVADIYVEYLDFFNKNGYGIQTKSLDPVIGHIYANLGTNFVNFKVSKRSDQSKAEIVISYNTVK